MKLYFSLMFLFLISTNLYSQFSGGLGTANNPYQITSRADMEALADSVDLGNNWSRGKYFKLINDIEDSIRTVVGYARNTFEYTRCFQGDFNGNNKKITLAIDGKWELWEDGNWHSVTRDYIGLFSALYKAKVYNLSIEGYVYGKTMVGGICGYAEESNILNCINICDVISNSFMYRNRRIGGFCGLISTGIISNCTNYGNIKGIGERIGGIAGEMSSVNATKCVNYGNIVGGSGYVGGICGIEGSHMSNAFLDCINYGNISGVHATGGIVGCLQDFSSLFHCTNTGAITATSAAGGIAGHTHNQTTISHCINIGTVQGDSVVGGIASGYDNHFEDHNGSINICHNAGLVIGNNIVGGIQGRCWGEIHNSLNTGVVVCETNAGGIAGEVNNTAIITNCHYDKQMCIHGGIAEKDATGQAEGYLTKGLIGNNLENKLGSADWTFDNANLYPTLKHYERDSVALVASSPVYLYDSDVADFDRQNKVKTDFKVNLENAVKWNRIVGNVDIVNDNGLVRNNGSDTLVCSIGSYKKAVPVNITLLPIGDVKFSFFATEHRQVSPTATNYNIPIYIKADAKTLQEIVIKRMTIEIDKNVFYLKQVGDNTTWNCNQNEIVIENIKIPPLNAGEEVVLFNLIGDVLLGTIDSSGIIIDTNIEFVEDLATNTDTKNGCITLNICHEGNDRFIGIAGNSPSLIIKNNPAHDILEVECNVVESERYMLEVVDMTGRSVKVEEFVAGGAGNKFYFTLSTENWSVGNYLLVLSTSASKYSAIFTIKR